MTKLPPDRILPTEKLAACFNNTSATYKFYWFLSILYFVEKGRSLISKKEMFACMISKAWYTVNYFHISFGAQDQLQRAIQNISRIEGIPVDAGQEVILRRIMGSSSLATISELKYFDANVPHWFLSPWFPGLSKDAIYRESNRLLNHTPYSLEKDFISINIFWADYLKKNVAVIRDFCFWNLSLYLQKRNPSVPDIPNKLIKPAKRSSLLKQRTRFWDIVFEKQKTIRCIYTGKPLVKSNYAVEHFIPYNFVSHNLIWNLIPSDLTFNSIKSDKLPPPELFFDPFFNLQASAIATVYESNPENKFLEEYAFMIPELSNSNTLYLKERFRETVLPLITIAHNNGFEYLKID